MPDAHRGIDRQHRRNNHLANTKERSFTLGLDNHGMRYFDPETGRYITRDPIGYADGPNVYLYVHNNPINHIDPLGLTDGPFSSGEFTLQNFSQVEQDEPEFLPGMEPYKPAWPSQSPDPLGVEEGHNRYCWEQAYARRSVSAEELVEGVFRLVEHVATMPARMIESGNQRYWAYYNYLGKSDYMALNAVMNPIQTVVNSGYESATGLGIGPENSGSSLSGWQRFGSGADAALAAVETAGFASAAMGLAATPRLTALGSAKDVKRAELWGYNVFKPIGGDGELVRRTWDFQNRIWLGWTMARGDQLNLFTKPELFRQVLVDAGKSPSVSAYFRVELPMLQLSPYRNVVPAWQPQ